MIVLTLASVRAALRAKNPDGTHLPSAIDRLALLVRREHREWWRVVHGVGQRLPWLPSWRAPANGQAMVYAGDDAAIVRPYDRWTADRWQPSGTHPEDVRVLPAEYEGPVLDEDALARRPRPSARQRQEVHDRDERACAACRARSATILGGCELSATVSAPSAPDPKAKRWSAEAADAARRRRIEKIKRPQDKGEDLTPIDWSHYWTLRHKAFLCGTHTAVLQRRVITAGGAVERMAVPLRCRTRECGPCAQVIADHAKIRMEGPWRQLVTLTLRQDMSSEAHTWRHISRWTSKLMGRLGKIARKGKRPCKCSRSPGRDPHSEIITDGCPFKYAWVIEPHEMGWPHVHIAWSPRYVCFDLVRDLWWEITGIENSGSWVEKLKDVWKIPYYLAKYLSKGRFSTRLLAMMWRRRLWASNIKAHQRVESGYELIEIMKGKEAEQLLNIEKPPLVKDPRGWIAEEHHWNFVEGMNGKYNKWSISGGIADIVSIGLNEELYQRSGEREMWEWSHDRMVARMVLDNGMGHMLGVKKRYLDIETCFVKAWKTGCRYDKDGNFIENVLYEKGPNSGGMQIKGHRDYRKASAQSKTQRESSVDEAAIEIKMA